MARRISLILILAVLCNCKGLFAETLKIPPVPSVETSVNKKTAGIGEDITYSVSVTAGKDMELEIEDFGGSLADINVADSGRSERVILGKKKKVQWYILNCFVTGKVTLPKLTVKYRQPGNKEWKELKTEERAIEIKSELDEKGGQEKLRDIRPPVALPSKQAKLLFIFIVLVFIAIAVVLARLFFKKTKAKCLPQRVRPAHEIALEQLEALRRKDLVRQGKIKEYYYEISGIIRHYLENRFRLQAPEMTTEEFLLYVRDYSGLAREHKELLKDFLVLCDMVKFAKYDPDGREIDSVLDSAEKFIGQTKEDVISK